MRGKILPDGTVADHASVALHRLRRDIERQQRQIQKSLERFLRAHREEGMLQEEFVTIRNERFVVPVIAGQQRKVDGVIHGASASGHTLFVEPLETIDLNNELVRLREEELREVHRILREMTERLRAHAPQIQSHGGSAWASWSCSSPRPSSPSISIASIPRFSPDSERRLLLQATRAIRCSKTCCGGSKKPVVPISLDAGRSARTLLISGPNTGGKTVTLKTVGLLA